MKQFYGHLPATFNVKRLVFLVIAIFSLCVCAEAQEKSNYVKNRSDFERLTNILLSGKIDSTEFVSRVKTSGNHRNRSITNSDHQTQTQVLATGQVYYVNSSSPGGNGLSWATAFRDLQSALEAATSGDQIWVAAGTYKPTATNTRSIAFELKGGMSLYGGFSGGESSIAERDWKSNPTVLSGEIGGPGLTDNSDHVIKCTTGSNIVFDGFIVEKGYASQSYYGGGMYCSGVGSMKIQHCVFRNNYANYHGGGIYILNSAVDVVNSEFYDNQTISYDGGGYFATGSQPKKIIGSLFHHNQSGRAGGAIENYNSTLQVVNTTVVDNVAHGAYGNGLASWSGTANVYNSIFHQNSTTVRNLSRLGGGYIYVYHSLVQFGSYTSGTNVLLNVDPLLEDPANGNYRLQSASPCIDSGTSDTTNWKLPDSDLDGQPRVFNNRVDMGAYEKGEENAVQTQLSHIFGALDQSYIHTGILTDFGIDLADQTLFDGVVRPENIMDMNSWRALYGSLLSSSINPSSKLIHLKTINQELEDLWETYDRNNRMVDIAVLFAAYQTLRSDAISENLIAESDGRLYDVPGRTESPYTTAYAFAAAPNLEYDEDGKVTFVLRSGLFVNSSGKTFSSFQVDFGDGAGYQTLTMDTPYTVNYSSEGTKTLKFKTRFTDGSTWYSHSNFRVLSASSAMPALRFDGTGDHTYIFPRSADAQCPEPGFPDPEAWEGSFSGATVTVEYGNPRANTNPGCNPEFIRPLIVVEGYDPSKFSAFEITNWDYEDIAINILSRGVNGNLNILLSTGNTFNEELEAAGYDLIFVDFKDGTGDIIRNAYLLENVIRWVNAHKINNAEGNREENVVLGQSMGGMVARYAVCDMEKRMMNDPANNPDHETRLLVTHDAPHRGANVPLGFQALVNELAPMKLDKIGLVTYGSTGAIIGSFLEMKDIVPALDQAQQLLNEPASQQMLVVQDGRNNTFLEGDYRNMVTFPSGYAPTFNMIALANGSECGEGQEFVQPGDELFYADANLYVNRLLFFLGVETAGANASVQPGLGVITRSALYALAPFTGKHWKTSYIVRAAPSSGTNQAFYGKIDFQKKILFLINLNIKLFEKSRNSEAGALPWDSAPGGYYSLRDVQGRIPSNPDINAYPLIDANLTVRLVDAFDFVPTVSALDIDATPIPKASLSSPYNGGINYQYPSRFANFISQERNPGEVNGSEHNSRHIQFTPRNAQWLLNEMEGVPDNNLNCSADCEPDGISVLGSATICSQETYTVDNLPDGYAISWANNGLSYVSGQNTLNYTVQANTATTNPWVEAILTGTCTMHYRKELVLGGDGIAYADLTIEGPDAVCPNEWYMFRADNQSAIAITEYDWIFPFGWTIVDQHDEAYYSKVTVSTPSQVSNGDGVDLTVLNICGTYQPEWYKAIDAYYACPSSASVSLYPNPADEYIEVSETTLSAQASLVLSGTDSNAGTGSSS
ncbi:choice-of-anchor Q domain-containing protein, partial [Fulvivirga kasyanovii]